MNIFVINSGSSSIKYQLFTATNEAPLCSGLVERIGLADGHITHKFLRDGQEVVINIDRPVADHEAGMLEIGELLTRPDIAVIHHAGEIGVVGHRVVHGGETLTRTTVITPDVKAKIKDLYPLAPLHNPGHYKGIEVAEKIFPQAIQIAVFDTAFHQTLPAKAFHYAIPESFYKDFGIRVYGFHGISHQYVSGKAMSFLGKPDARLITIHLGNGCSMAAVQAGRSIDTSMGLTPLDGLVMGTRSGSIDASVLLYLMEQKQFSAAQLSTLLNKQSGMTGLTGHSDMRDITQQLQAGDPQAQLAYALYAYRIKKFIGAYAAAMNGLDAIVFTAGVGENDPLVRELVCKDMDFLGIALDATRNATREPGIRDISAHDAKTKVLVVPTNEELEIARQCRTLLEE
ncbi:acetate kinase [Chitinophaga costaii]|uniref:Acetate kinase n=1 Tax=Chitinophaga costaii TaxID=1335309 RepID=A0A1C4EH41_9BACT|nr:acetate kinase [Chitinophaga costaii]PUZ23832.1 acetate kinase [Chitinophaga costaii]SCC42822.1 acetate kinase [Chitinophaga costaii]